MVVIKKLEWTSFVAVKCLLYESICKVTESTKTVVVNPEDQYRKIAIETIFPSFLREATRLLCAWLITLTLALL